MPRVSRAGVAVRGAAAGPRCSLRSVLLGVLAAAAASGGAAPAGAEPRPLPARVVGQFAPAGALFARGAEDSGYVALAALAERALAAGTTRCASRRSSSWARGWPGSATTPAPFRRCATRVHGPVRSATRRAGCSRRSGSPSPSTAPAGSPRAARSPARRCPRRSRWATTARRPTCGFRRRSPRCGRVGPRRPSGGTGAPCRCSTGSGTSSAPAKRSWAWDAPTR